MELLSTRKPKPNERDLGIYELYSNSKLSREAAVPSGHAGFSARPPRGGKCRERWVSANGHGPFISNPARCG